MSSSEGLARLKNWQRAEKALVLPSVSLKGKMSLFEVRVKVVSVDGSTLVLANRDAPGETETIALGGVAFAGTDERDLELTLADGKIVYLREE